MSQVYSILRLTDGLRTAVLNGTISDVAVLLADGYSPPVARRTTAPIAGEQVSSETSVINLSLDGTAGNLTAQLELIEELVHQGARWQAGDQEATAVRFEVLPQWSTEAAPWRVPVLGPPDRGNVLTLPANYFDLLAAKQVDGVRLTFKHRGLWTLPKQAFTSATGPQAANNGITIGMADPDQPVPYPLHLKLAYSNGCRWQRAAVWGLTRFGHFKIVNAKDVASVPGAGGTTTSANDAAALARGGAVLRITRTNPYSPGQFTFTLTPSALDGPVRRVVLLMAARQNSGADWGIKGWTTDALGARNIETPVTVVPGAVLGPDVYVLGSTISARSQHQTMTLSIERLTGTASDELDIDWVAAVGMDERESRMVVFRPSPQLEITNASDVTEMHADAAPVSGVLPATYVLGTGALQHALTAEGDPAFTWRRQQATFLWFQTSSPWWQPPDSSGTAVAQGLLSLGAYPSTLVVH